MPKLIDTLDDALASLDADLAVKREVVAERKAALEEAEEAVRKLELSRLGIETAKDYFGQTTASAPASAAETEPAMEGPPQAKISGGFSPSALVERLIKESGQTRFTNEDVNQWVKADGWVNMTRTQISNALTYLSRPSVAFIRKAGARGNWELVNPPTDTDGPTEAGPSDQASPPLAPETEGSGHHPLITG